MENDRTILLHVIASVLLRDMVKSDVPHTPAEFATELWNYIDAVEAEGRRRSDERQAQRFEEARAHAVAQAEGAQAAAAPEQETGAAQADARISVFAGLSARPQPGDTCECPACTVRRALYGPDPQADLDKMRIRGKAH